MFPSGTGEAIVPLFYIFFRNSFLQPEQLFIMRKLSGYPPCVEQKAEKKLSLYLLAICFGEKI
jgi:hypothetical protein